MHGRLCLGAGEVAVVVEFADDWQRGPDAVDSLAETGQRLH